MNTLNEGGRAAGCGTPRVKMKMLEQMAEALEDEAAGLLHRAATFEEEEYLLNREIAERQTEINRLHLKLEALHAERDGLLEKVEAIKSEAGALREEIFTREEEAALAAIESATIESERRSPDALPVGQERPARNSVFFTRMSVGGYVRS
jgi:hypothetical protein